MTTVTDILIAWLRDKSVFTTADVEMELPRYGQLLFSQSHTPSHYSRELRAIREKNKTLSHGYRIVNIKDRFPNRRQATWEKQSIQNDI